jgi:hypothetical protein
LCSFFSRTFAASGRDPSLTKELQHEEKLELKGFLGEHLSNQKGVLGPTACWNIRESVRESKG